MPRGLRIVLGVCVVALIVGAPVAHFRSSYANYKRFRVVTPDRFYRSGQLTAGGLRDVVKRFGIRTVINLQEENTDPFMPEVWLGQPSIRESQLCSELGVTYYALFGGEIIPQHELAQGMRPKVIDQYLGILDNPANYPVLLHCKAGLHRTGLLTAVYRREFEGWSVARAVEELRANGFGTYMATSGNVYLQQYVDRYRVGERRPVTPAVPGAPRTVAEGPR
jgi:tyrosine-protein phosphatase SIW14